MDIVVLDLESFFDRKDFSLSKMTTEAYVRDKRFEVHCAGIKWSPTTATVAYTEPEFRWQLKNHDWSNTFLICHHVQFDGLVLSHHYGVVPKMYGCTLSMARQLLGNHVSASLDSVRKHFGMPLKSTPYQWFEGRHWHEITKDVQEQMLEGCADEVESIWKIFCEFAKTFPAEEYDVVDTTIRMFTEPCLLGDQAVFKKVYDSEALKKATVLERLGVTEGELQSADRFAELLREYGVEPATKDGNPSKVTGEVKQIYAFAKTDPFMEELLVDEDEDVRALAEARLGVKSTLLQTRAETMGGMASRGPLCVYLSYCAAHTSRWGGGDGCLVADTRVLVLDVSGAPRYKRIVDVLLTDLVWDGEEFVEHDGVAFQGYKEVVSWDGIDGTPEHPVMCGETWTELREALRTETPIVDCREPTAWEVEAGRARQRSRT